MLTSCGICGCALVVPQGEDSSAFCQACYARNFSGQSIPDVDVPHVTVVPSRRHLEALARLAARHREEEA